MSILPHQDPECYSNGKNDWDNEEDISDAVVLRRIINDAGDDESGYFKKITLQSYKDKLRVTMDELIDCVVFGAPTLFINELDMGLGNDRLLTVEP